MPLRVSLAGRIGLDADGEVVEADGLGRLGRLAFAYLVTERHRAVPRDELADVLWGENLPRSWPTSLRVLVSKVRLFLGRAGVSSRDTLTTEHGCICLSLPDGTIVDVEEATRAVADAERLVGGDPVSERDAAHARQLASDGLAVAAAVFLPGATDAWTERRQAELRDLQLRALEVLADALLLGGDAAAAAHAVEEAVTLEPFRESAWLRLMSAQAAAGNRGAALRSYERCRALLIDELGVGPSSPLEAAYLRLLEEGPATAPSVLELPRALTSFVGRDDDVGEIATALGSARLVTLIGPGGVGKSRLALEAATRALGEFTGGAALVDLGGVADPALVVTKMLAATEGTEAPGVTARDALAGHLRTKRVLVVLDNCEHIVAEAAGLVEHLLLSCPELAILATSREPLGVPGETIWPVRSLSVPPAAGDQTVEDVLGYEAVCLFVERCQSAVRGFELRDADVEAAVRICRELDGIPLALELAAARAGGLSLTDIAARLDDRFSLLARGARTAPARQRTLRATVEWSYDTLSPAERAVLRRASVFGGGFTVDAAETVCVGPESEGASLVDAVSRLVETSLLVPEERRAASGRYRFLQTIRQYGWERLGDSGEREVVRDRHLDWAATFAQDADAVVRQGGDQAQWLDRLEAEQDNFGAALAWATTAAPRQRLDGLRLAVALAHYWEFRGHLSEGRRWLEELLATSDDDDPGMRARARVSAGILSQRQGDYRAAHEHYQSSLILARELNDRAALAAAMHGLGNVAALQGDPAARFFFDESLSLGRELQDDHVIAASLTNLGTVAQNQGELVTAGEMYREAVALSRSLGDKHGVAMLLGNLGYLAFQRGDFARAHTLDDESLRLRRELGDLQGLAMVLGNMGHLSLHAGDNTTARRLYEECLALRRELGDRHGQAGALANLAELARVEGDLKTAGSLLQEGIEIARDLGDRYRQALLLVRWARVANDDDDFRGAARLCAEAIGVAGEVPPESMLAECMEAAAAAGAGMGKLPAAAWLLRAAACRREIAGLALPPLDAADVERVRILVRDDLGDEWLTDGRDAAQPNDAQPNDAQPDDAQPANVEGIAERISRMLE